MRGAVKTVTNTMLSCQSVKFGNEIVNSPRRRKWLIPEKSVESRHQRSTNGFMKLGVEIVVEGVIETTIAMVGVDKTKLE